MSIHNRTEWYASSKLYENTTRIARIFADESGWCVRYTWFNVDYTKQYLQVLSRALRCYPHYQMPAIVLPGSADMV